MHVVIMGCGRVGSTLAHSLEQRGHSVAVVDQSATSFRRLGSDFRGTTVTGVGFDREVLVQAGIAEADAFAAVSSGDNSNIIAARVARETFGLGNVVARIYDPGRAEVYQRLGIPTVATVRWTADQVLRRLLPAGTAAEWREPTGRLLLAEVAFCVEWVGQRISAVEAATGSRLAYLTRLGEGEMPTPTTLVQEGDLLHLVMPVESTETVSAVLAAAPPHEGQH